MSVPVGEPAIGAMVAEIAALREEVHELRSAVQAAHGRVRLSMREQTRCPSCGETKILHSTRVSTGMGDAQSLCLWQPDYNQRKASLRTKVLGKVPIHALLEVYICMNCRLTEWYTQSLEDLDLEQEQFRVLEGAVADGSYR